MISKGMLKIDLIGQSLIIVFMLLYLLFTPSSAFLVGLLTLFILGFWQFSNGLIEAVFYKSKNRQKYVFAAIAYMIGFGILISMNYGLTAKIENQFMEIFVFIYFVGGSLALAGWYFYQTYKELDYSKYRHPRSFWDYEF